MRGDRGQNRHEGTFVRGDGGQNCCEGMFVRGDGGQNCHKGTFARERSQGGDNLQGHCIKVDPT